MTTRTLLAALLLLGATLPWHAVQAQEGRTIAIQAQLHETSFGLHLVPERMDARVGDTLVVEVVNQGSARHDVVFCGDPPGGSGTCNDKWAASPILDGGQSANVTIKVTKAGTFEYFCDLPGHKQGGMKGELVVQEAPGGSKKATPGPAPILALLAVAAAALLVLPRRRSP